MKNKLLFTFIAFNLLFLPKINFAQAVKAVKDTVTVLKNTQKRIGVLANDSNVNYSSFNLSMKTMPLHGSIALTAGGDSILYTPAFNYTGMDSMYYRICNGSPSACDSAWVVMNIIAPPNSRPDAVNDILATFRNTTKKFSVLSNDTDPDGNALTLSIITQAPNGTATVIGDSVSYTPNNNFRGKDSIQYKICDNGTPSLCDSAWAFIFITNRRPIALNDTAVTFRYTPKKIAVLINDMEPDSDPLTLSIQTFPSHGSVLFINDTANYLPYPNFMGLDSLRYRICDNQNPSLCDSAWVFIRVLPVIQGSGGGTLFADGNIAICYALFTSIGNITNTGATTVVGDIGTNSGSITGFNASLVSGAIHTPPDSSTSHVAGDVNTNYNFYNSLTPHITLTPSQFGNNLVLVPRVYRISGSTTLADSVTFSAQNNPDALFIIQVTGAYTSAIASKIILKDSAHASNIIWKIDGSANIGAGAIFNGTIFGANNITIGSGANIDGRAFTTSGSISLNTSSVHIPKGLGPCGAPTTNSAPFAMNDTTTTPKNISKNIDVLFNDWDPNGDQLNISIRALPAHGTAVITANNLISYSPTTGYVGFDTLIYRICDNGTPTLCDSAWVFINVGPNTPPVAVNDTAKTNKNTAVTINVTVNDFDANNDPLSVSIATGGAPLHGTAVIIGNNVRYTPFSTHTGWDTLRYKICDNGTPVYCDSAWVFINTVTNNAPIAVNDTLTTLLNTPIIIDVTANDSDPDGDSLNVSILISPNHGTVSMVGKQVRYVPANNFLGLDSFSYQICDGGIPNLCASAWVFIKTVTNRPPMAFNDYVTARINSPIIINVTANDSDPDGDPLAVSILGTAKHGTLSLTGNNIRYSPNFNYLGPDSFPYKICDNGSPVLCDSAWVYVTTVVNRAPLAVDDYVTIHKNTTVTVNVTANDSEPDNDPLSVSIRNNPVNGIAIVVGINIRYTPNSAFVGKDSLLYQICDNRTPVLCDSAWVYIDVTDNRAPVAVDDYATILRNTVAMINVTANDSDPDNDPLIVTLQTSPKHGTAIMVGNNVRYTPDFNFIGFDSLSYEVCDNQIPSLCDQAWVYINTVINRPPVATDDYVVTGKNIPVSINVTANDFDPDGNLLTVSLMGTPKHGSIALAGNNINYTPAVGYLGKDTFPYRICDNGTPVMCDTAWVYVNIVANRPPVAVNDYVTTHKNMLVSVNVTANDSDPDGDALTVNIVQGGMHGNAIVLNNYINYVPDPNFIGTDSLLYQICDGSIPLMCAEAWVIIRVIDNQPPVANDDYAQVLRNNAELIHVTANDNDPDGDPLTVSMISSPVHGIAVVIGNNIRYTPDNNYVGSDSLSYRICDNGNPALCDLAWVHIDVVTNRAPVAVNDFVSTLKNIPLTVKVTANDYDPDGNLLSVAIRISPQKGSVTLIGNDVRYTPNNNFTGLDSFAYRICDNGSPVMCDSAWVFIEVVTNRPPVAANDFVNTPKNFPVTINVTANDFDPDGNLLSVSIIGTPNHGTIILIGNNIRYTPNLDYIGVDSLTYKICDNGSPTLCDSAWVYINVITQSANRPPVAINDQLAICNDGSTYPIGVQFNDSDPDLDSLTTGIASGPSHGVASLSGNDINYKPNTGFSGLDTIAYFVCDDNIPSLCASAYVIITVNQQPASLSVAEQRICAGSSVVIGKPAIAGNTYSWSPITGLNSPFISQPTASPVVTTNYILTETVTATGCWNTSSINVIVNPLPLAITGPNQIIYDEKSAIIGAAPVANHTYSWTPALGLNFPNISQPVARPSITTIYTLTETDTITGCSRSNSVMIAVVKVEFFNGFSPNGDGRNDFWKIPLLDIYPSNRVVIVNRWGNEVWNTLDYNNTSNYWDGKNNNGVDLPDGTYYYILNFNNEVKHGWVVLKR